MNLKVIGIDPGIASVGYAVVEFELLKNNRPDYKNINLLECGVIRTETNKSQSERLCAIRKDLLELLSIFSPDIVAVELLYFAQNVKTAISVAQARGVILEAIASQGITKLTEVTPTNVKQTLLGHGRADKKQIQEYVSNFFGLPKIIKPDDAADAVAIALCSIRLYGVS